LGARNLAELPDVFAKKVLDMQKGQVSSPIRTGNGLHLLLLVGIEGYNGKHEVTKTHARHILLKPASNMTSEEAKRQVNNLYQQLQSGKDFAAMAKQYSLDSVSGAKGGDLGWVSPGELVPEVERVMTTLKPHQVSKPVKSRFGWHLIEVLERKSINDTESYKRQQVRMFLSQRKFTEAVENWQQHLRATAYIKIMDKSVA
jgi:peptidyl-prolyl cis-trans isomerase SurA